MTVITGTFQQKLQNLLREHGAASDFCRKTGFSRTALRAWSDGTSWPTLPNLEKIAEGLGVSIQELLGLGPETRASLLGAVVVALGGMNEAKLALVLDYVRALDGPTVATVKGAAHDKKTK